MCDCRAGRSSRLGTSFLADRARRVARGSRGVDVVLRDRRCSRRSWRMGVGGRRAARVWLCRPTIADRDLRAVMVVKHDRVGYETLCGVFRIRCTCVVSSDRARRGCRRSDGQKAHAWLGRGDRRADAAGDRKGAARDNFGPRAVRMIRRSSGDVRYRPISGLTLDGRGMARAVAQGDCDGRRWCRGVVDRRGRWGAAAVDPRRRQADRERKAEVLALTEQAGGCSRLDRQKPAVAVMARRRPPRRRVRPSGNSSRSNAGRVTTGRACHRQIKFDSRRPDPDASSRCSDPTRDRSAKASSEPNEFGYVAQICEVTRTPSQGRAGSSCRLDDPQQPAGEHAAADHDQRAGAPRLRPREARARRRLPDASDRRSARRLEPERVFIAGRQQPGRGEPRRLARYRVGAEGRISHSNANTASPIRSKRRRAARLERLAIATYNLDTSPSEPTETIHRSTERAPFARTAASTRHGRLVSSAINRGK